MWRTNSWVTQMVCQADVLAFMEMPSSYTPAPERIDRFDTHGAIVFLAGDEAYKIKRAVSFDYMDFSTLEKRRRICEHEYLLNRQFAPGIYLGVVPVTREGTGALSLGGEGEPVEWTVHMRRFDQKNLLSNQAESGGITATLIKSLAATIAGFHRELGPAGRADGAARIEAIVEELVGNFSGLTEELDGADVDQFARLVREQFGRSFKVLNARAAAGYVRRCHGDLHLANIVLQNDRPVLFDVLEFDEELATTDIFYELAFLLMDLMHRGLRAEANLLLNRYLFHMECIDHFAGLQALPLFLGLRAAIRAMVTAQRAQQHADAELREEAARYLRDAIGLLSPPDPRLVAVGGFSGTGKSTLAAALAPDTGPVPGAVHIRSDLERKLLFGADETERLPPESYTQNASARVYELVMAKVKAVLGAGHAVITDAVFARADERNALQEIARSLGVSFTGLWLAAPGDVLKFRVESRKDDASDATSGVVDLQLEYDTGKVDWTKIDASGTPADTLLAARQALDHG